MGASAKERCMLLNCSRKCSRMPRVVCRKHAWAGFRVRVRVAVRVRV